MPSVGEAGIVWLRQPRRTWPDLYTLGYAPVRYVVLIIAAFYEPWSRIPYQRLYWGYLQGCLSAGYYSAEKAFRPWLM